MGLGPRAPCRTRLAVHVFPDGVGRGLEAGGWDSHPRIHGFIGVVLLRVQQLHGELDRTPVPQERQLGGEEEERGAELEMGFQFCLTEKSTVSYHGTTCKKLLLLAM